MKIWKIILISAIIAIINLPLHFWAYHTFYVEPILASIPEPLRPYVDPYPFFETLYGSSTIFVWICLLFLWGYLSLRITAKPKLTVKPAVATALLCFCLLIGAFTPMV